jgi:hypothetical protein
MALITKCPSLKNAPSFHEHTVLYYILKSVINMYEGVEVDLGTFCDLNFVNMGGQLRASVPIIFRSFGS